MKRFVVRKIANKWVVQDNLRDRTRQFSKHRHALQSVRLTLRHGL